MKLSLTCVVSLCGHVFQVELSARLAVSASERLCRRGCRCWPSSEKQLAIRPSQMQMRERCPFRGLG